MPASGAPPLARAIIAGALAAFAVVVVGDGLGLTTAPLDGAVDGAYTVVQILGFGACALRALSAEGSERAAWAVLSLGLLGFLAGDVVYGLSGAPPSPSIADVGFMALYPAAYAALVLLLRSRAGRTPSGVWLDGLICALAVAALGAALVLDLVARAGGQGATVVTNLAYPLGDLVLLGFSAGVLVVAGRGGARAWATVAAGFAVFAVTDAVFLVRTAQGSYEPGTLLDAGWAAMFVLVAIAAWQPRPAMDARRVPGPAMLALPAVAGVLSLGVLVVDHYARLHTAALWLATACLAVVLVRFAAMFRDNLRMLRASEREATTDPLTGLGNRRALVADLDRAVAAAGPGSEHVLALFDLDGFKGYNDAFGHPAGDALLERVGRRLAAVLAGAGRAYRMGGDEFCLLAPARGEDAGALVLAAADALCERGERFEIRCSHGWVLLDGQVTAAGDALRLADRRMYAAKRSGRPGAADSVQEVLLSVVGEHDGDLRDHVVGVADLAEAVGRRLGLGDTELAHLRTAAALHDIGKVAIPDAILHARRPLTAAEWEYMRRHTLIGARIIGAAPELAPVAAIVRSSHERYDGAGYPDALAGDAIPLAARIVAVCDAYEAMTTSRPYREAITPEAALRELERCAGSQFDPVVVRAFATTPAVRAERSLAA